MRTFESNELTRSPKVCGCDAPAALKAEIRTKLERNLELAYDGSAAMAMPTPAGDGRKTIPWNIAVATRFDTASRSFADQTASAVAHAADTCVVAFDREDWRWLEAEFGMQGKPDVAMRLVKMLHSQRLVRRYDVLYPVDRATMRIWTLPEASMRPPRRILEDGDDRLRCMTCEEPQSPERRLLRCAGCFAVRYCSTECQRADKANHREFCRTAAQSGTATKSVFLRDMQRVGYGTP